MNTSDRPTFKDAAEDVQIGKFWTAEELKAIEELRKDLDMSALDVLRQALRLYQAVALGAATVKHRPGKAIEDWEGVKVSPPAPAVTRSNEEKIQRIGELLGWRHYHENLWVPPNVTEGDSPELHCSPLPNFFEGAREVWQAVLKAGCVYSGSDRCSHAPTTTTSDGGVIYHVTGIQHCSATLSASYGSYTGEGRTPSEAICEAFLQISEAGARLTRLSPTP